LPAKSGSSGRVLFGTSQRRRHCRFPRPACTSCPFTRGMGPPRWSDAALRLPVWPCGSATQNDRGNRPVLLDGAADVAALRKAQRHIAQWHLQPNAARMAEEATARLGQPVTVDVMQPLQPCDAGGRARAAADVVQAARADCAKRDRASEILAAQSIGHHLAHELGGPAQALVDGECRQVDQELEPPANPARFKLNWRGKRHKGRHSRRPRAQACPDGPIAAPAVSLPPRSRRFAGALRDAAACAISQPA